MNKSIVKLFLIIIFFFVQNRVLFSQNNSPYIQDFRVNEQIGNSQKGYTSSAINDNGVSLIVWSDYREGSTNIYGQLINSNGEIISDNFKINIFEGNKTFNYPDVAVNEDNQFLVVWYDVRNNYAIYGQLISENGELIGDNFQISDENNTRYKNYPSVASNGKKFVIAWLDSRNGNNYDVFSQLLDKNGNKIGENFIVNTDSQATLKQHPEIAIDKNGNIMAAWYSTERGSYDISACLLDSNKSIILPTSKVSDTTETLNNYNPKVASSDSGFVVGWYKYGYPEYEVNAQFIKDSGELIDSIKTIGDNNDIAKNNLDITSNKDGKSYFVWEEYQNGIYRLISQEFLRDSVEGDIFQVSEDDLPAYKSDVSVAINNEGKFISAWQDKQNPNEYRIYSRLFDTDNNPVNSSLRVDNDENSSNQTEPAITVFDNKSFITAWTDQRNKTYQTFFQKYDSNGMQIGDNILVDDGGTQYRPSIYGLADNNFMVIYTEYYRDVNNQNEIFAQKYFKTGEKLGDKILVSNNSIAGNSNYASGASKDDGEGVIVWEKRIGSSNRIYAQRFNENGSKVGEEITVSDDTTSYYYRPKVGIDGNGNFAVTCYKIPGYNILLYRYNNNGEKIDSTIIVNENMNSSNYYPDIDVNSEGDCVVTWFGYNPTSNMKFQRYKNIGSQDSFEKINSNKNVSTQALASYSPKVGLNENGNFAISWPVNSGGFRDVQFRIFDNTGNPISDVLSVSESTGRDQINPDIAFVGNKIYNVWQDNHEQHVGYDIWANIYNVDDFVTGVQNKKDDTPTTFKLVQNYPNPFNPTTTIQYSIPQQTTGNENYHSVKLIVFDILGRKVATLVNQKQSAGNYKVNFNASYLASGVYYYRLKVGEPSARSGQVFVQTKKMLLLK